MDARPRQQLSGTTTSGMTKIDRHPAHNSPNPLYPQSPHSVIPVVFWTGIRYARHPAVCPGH